MNFWKLYSIVLTFCVALVQMAQLSWIENAPPPKKTDSATVIAIPPKPEGVMEPSQGEGDQLVYTEAGCKKQPAQFRDICFHQLARQQAYTDLKGALSSCDKIERQETIYECQSDVAELYSPVDREASLAVCPSIERKKWRDQCVFGIALAYSIADSPWAFRLCDRAGQWRDFCRHDVNGEIAVVNPDLALEHCHAEEGDLLTRKTCWHGIGKYIARVDIDKAFAACDRVPSGPQNLYRENCIHGLAWGASETAEEAFLAQCERAGKEKDSCFLGVAYNLRRFDIDRGLAICADVKRGDLKEKCIQFVSGG